MSHEHDQVNLEANIGSAAAPTYIAHPGVVENPDPNVVDWDGPDDPQNPRNWKASMVIVNISIVSAITFLSALSSSIFAPGILQVLGDFNSTSSTLASFIVSVYVIGYGFGPLFIAPLSETYGRTPLYHICGGLFIVFSAACALAPSLAALIIFRLFAGLAGSCPLALSAGTIADLIPHQKRGKVTAAWTLGPLLGPVVGPIGGGYLIEAKGWRWSFWLVTIVASAIFIIALLFMRETYAYAVLNHKVKKLRKETGNQELRSALKYETSHRATLKTAIVRPTKMLLCLPVIFLTSMILFLFYGYFYLLFTALPGLFQDEYGFSTGSVGLTYIGLGVGSIMASLIAGSMSDKLAQRMNKTGGEPKPECRLPLLAVASFVVPIGLFWTGWTAQSHQHWMLPILGTSVLSVGVIFAFNSSMTYLIDAYGVYSASAVAGSILLRSLGGALLPLAGGPMFDRLGFGWGSSLLAFIAIVMIPVPVAFMKYGERIRQKALFDVKF